MAENLQEREKDALKKLAEIFYMLPENKKEYWLGFGEGIASMCAERMVAKEST